MRRRAAAVLAVLSAMVAALPASGAPAPQVVDPRGDWPMAGQDILSASFATTGSGRSSALEIRLELAGPPLPDVGLYWEVGWSTPGCALNYVEYTRSAYGPGVEETELIRQCKPDGPFVPGGGAEGRLEGSTVVLTVPLRDRYPRGTLITDPYAMSFTFVLVHGDVPTWRLADETAKGRPYRVGTR